MPLVDPIRRTIALKFIYYGPTGVGKTASLKLLESRLRGGPHSGSASAARRPGRLLCLDTLDGHTLFFEILSIAANVLAVATAPALEGRRELDTRILLRLFSVPGGDMHLHTRRLLLRGADGIMLVGDKSQIARSTSKDEGSAAELRSCLRESGIDCDELPIITQPSPTRLGGATMVVESLLALLAAAWPAAERAALSAGLGRCELQPLLETLRKSLGVATVPEAPLLRPEPVRWLASDPPDHVRVMP
jgi:hypothetical protein